MTSKTSFESAAEAERILELAQKYDIGVILAESPESVEDWEILIDTIQHQPDPARLDQFIEDLPSDSMKDKLRKWAMS